MFVAWLVAWATRRRFPSASSGRVALAQVTSARARRSRSPTSSLHRLRRWPRTGSTRTRTSRGRGLTTPRTRCRTGTTSQPVRLAVHAAQRAARPAALPVAYLGWKVVASGSAARACSPSSTGWPGRLAARHSARRLRRPLPWARHRPRRLPQRHPAILCVVGAAACLVHAAGGGRLGRRAGGSRSVAEAELRGRRADRRPRRRDRRAALSGAAVAGRPCCGLRARLHGATPPLASEQARDPAQLPTWQASPRSRRRRRDVRALARLPGRRGPRASAVVACAATRLPVSRPRALRGGTVALVGHPCTSPGSLPFAPAIPARWCRWPPWLRCGSASAASPRLPQIIHAFGYFRPAIPGPGQPPLREAAVR